MNIENDFKDIQAIEDLRVCFINDLVQNNKMSKHTKKVFITKFQEFKTNVKRNDIFLRKEKIKSLNYLIKLVKVLPE